jgi:hypothetical protein
MCGLTHFKHGLIKSNDARKMSQKWWKVRELMGRGRGGINVDVDLELTQKRRAWGGKGQKGICTMSIHCTYCDKEQKAADEFECKGDEQRMGTSQTNFLSFDLRGKRRIKGK